METSLTPTPVRHRARPVKPQIVISVSGGVAYETVTRGDIDVVFVDWDNYDDSLFDYERADLTDKREQLSRIANPALRGQYVRDMDEIIANYDEIVEEHDQREAEYKARRIEEAKALLESEGIS